MKNKKQLIHVEEGRTFKLGDYEFIVLEHSAEGTCVLLKDFWKVMPFDTDYNDYSSSDVRNLLNTEFLNNISMLIGKENVIEHSVDLTADDGRKDYGECRDYISLITCDLYRKYVEILDKYNPRRWWWIATPYSTKPNGYHYAVRCVDDCGTLNCDYCGNDFGVRPFCILKSDIFVSE